MNVVRGVVEQHAEGAAFQWVLRDRGVHAAHYSLDDLAELDERLEAHLDGLRLAGDAGWEISREQLAWEEAGEVFTAGVLAVESGLEARISEVRAVATGSLELTRGLVSALAWIPFRNAQTQIRALLRSDQPLERRTGIGASAAHREDPGPALTAMVAEQQDTVRARALRAAGELGRTDLVGYCTANFASQDGECRFWGAASAALLGDPTATDLLKEIASSGGPRAEMACELAARKMHSGRAYGWLKELASAGSYRVAVIAGGAHGDARLVPWLIDSMKVQQLARPAGRAFSDITGIDLTDEGLTGEAPRNFEASPSDDPEEESVALDPDDDLPWPQPELVARWWQENRGRFQPGTRYLLGLPLNPDTCHRVLVEGRQRQRAAAAAELVLRQSGRSLFEVRARADRQRRLLKTKWKSIHPRAV